uniref:Uncharacterized protein LOC111112665 isoform X3 n=1 Tax=Crassostrea virginica TaxID=6565 RepID=A0A8B8BRW8_CRAVI|nr:uncharacterized protein LOC111112665 isoform X3 [Crassostrea virginica]
MEVFVKTMKIQIVFLCMIHVTTGSVFQRVHECPAANNLIAWKKASLRFNCSEYSEHYTINVIRRKMLYHCLPSIFLNETIEFCGPNAAIERGKCPIYNYVFGATAATGSSCTNFTRGCPDPKHSPYHSSSFYKYNACWDINKEFRCFHAEPNCPQREDRRYTTIPTDAKTTPSTDKNTNRYRTISTEARTPSSTEEITNGWKAGTIVAVCIATCLTVVVFGILFYFLKYKRIPTESDADVEERKAFIVKIHRATLDGRFNKFVKALNEAMSPDVLENIKSQLQERPENESELASLGNPDEVLTYLDRTYQVFNNVYFLQGLFLAAQAPELYKICLDYAKTREKKIIFFEKQILETDHTKVQYFVHFPNVSSYSNSDLEAVQDTIATLLFAKYDDVIVCGIKNGCVIAIFMIRNYLIPHLRVLFGSKEKILFQRMLKHKIFKVVVRDDVIYKRDWQIVANKPNVVAKPAGLRETCMDTMFHCANVGNGVNTGEAKERVQEISRYKVERKLTEKEVNRSLTVDSNEDRTMESEKESNQKNEPEAEFKENPMESEMEKSVQIEDSIADRKSESQDEKSNQTDESDIEVKRKPKEKEVNISLTEYQGCSRGFLYCRIPKRTTMATKENRNFLTVQRALDKPCTNLMQEVLRQYVPEKDIHKLLNETAKKRTIIPFVRKLNQETTLYPQTGVFNGSYANFDLSLLYVLIRNLTGIPSHTTGWGNAPDSMDNSTAANIERIRLLRNKYAHASTSHLTDKELKKERKNIISCIHGIERMLKLNSTQFEDAAEAIFKAAKEREDFGENLTKCQDDCRTMLKRQDEHENHLLKKTEEMQGDILTVHEILDELEKPLQKNTRKLQETKYETSIITQWQEDDEFFVSTKAAENVSKMVETNNLVIVTGHSGSGKSAIIQHIALQYRGRGWVVKPVYSFKEIHETCKSENFEKASHIFVFNDPIGKESYDEMSYNEWVRYRETFDLLIKRAKLLLTCRSLIVSDKRATGFFEQKLGELGINEQKFVKVDIDDNHCRLTTDEKKSMFKKHLPHEKPTEKEFNQICKIDMYFPLLCKLCRGQLIQKRNIVDVFKEPANVLETEIKRYKTKDKEVYCGLVCLILSKNDLSLSDLKNNNELFSKTLKMCELHHYTLPSTIIDKLKPLCGFLVKNNGEKYSFYHDFVMEVTTYVCGSDHPEEILDFADVSFLRKRVSVEKRKSNDPFTIVLEHQHIEKLVNRLIKELSGDRFIEVILSPCLRNKHVIRCVKNHLNDLSRNGMLELITKPQKTNTENKEFEHDMNDSLYTRLQFVSSMIEISPLFALITFCHDELSEYCLNLLKTNENLMNLFRKRAADVKKKSLFPAICANGNTDFLQMFTDDEIVECKNIKWNNMYPIHIISVFHNYHILDNVIKEDTNVDIFTTDKNAMTPLLLASGNKAQERGCQIERKGKSTDSTSRNKTVERLIFSGAGVNLCDRKGQSPLHKACQNGYESTAKLLLDNKAVVNLCDNNGNSPLLAACHNGHESTAKLLLANGADVNLCNKNGWFSLLIACFNGDESTANLLLANDADVNLCNKSGNSPLYKACYYGHESTAKRLLVNGADVNLCDKNGDSPLSAACYNGHENTAELLLVNDADVNLCNNSGKSPLFKACYNGHESTAKLLLVNGADLNLCDKNGISPQQIACQNGHKINFYLT